jgi:hypothetical protein
VHRTADGPPMKVCFIGCEIKSDKPKFLGDEFKNSNIKSLDLDVSGHRRNSDWKTHPERLENIIKSISKNKHLKKNLETISLYRSGISKEEVESMCEK